MVCKHLQHIEQAMLAAGMRETYRGKAWSGNCREWVYFDCYLDVDAVRARFTLPDCVVVHKHRGTHDGEEQGLECSLCHDGVMGRYEPSPQSPTFPLPR